jgi:hypothetical protein
MDGKLNQTPAVARYPLRRHLVHGASIRGAVDAIKVERHVTETQAYALYIRARVAVA